MDPVTKRFGQRLKALRLARGWTQDQLGTKAGMDPKHIGVIERGQKSSSFEAVAKLASALKVDMHELFMPDNGLPVKDLVLRQPMGSKVKKLSQTQMANFIRTLHTSLDQLLR